MALNWDLVNQGIKTGSYNLLLGAGISLDSISNSVNSEYSGQKLPSAETLRLDLLKLTKDVRPNSSLQRVFGLLDSKQIENHITERFQDVTPGASVTAITNFRWRRIFTLNVDDALENAYTKNPNSSQIPISVGHKDDYFDDQDKRKIPIIHLHGFVGKQDDGYIFDIKQYMRSVAENNLWAHVLGNIMRTEPFIVIGASLEEPDITYFLSERSKDSVRSDRPPSILVEPYPDYGTKKECLDYELNLQESNAVDFFHKLEIKVPNRPSVFNVIEENLLDILENVDDSQMASLFHSDFERVPLNSEKRDAANLKFSLGHPATWQDIEADKDIPRESTSNIFTSIRDAKGLGSTLLISGEAGAGKTTILKRLAKTIAAEGELVFWCRAVGRLNVAAAASILKSINQKVYIFIDNFADQSQSVNELKRTNGLKKVIFIGAERAYRIAHIERVMGKGDISKKFIKGLSKPEAKKLIESYVDLGLSSTTEINKNLSNFVDKIHGDPIAVACCRIMNDYSPLNKIIDRSFADASLNAKKTYIYAALASHCTRHGVLYDILGKLMIGYDIEFQMDELDELPLQFHDYEEREFVVPLNEAFSSSILRRSQERNPEDILQAFVGLASGIRPYVNKQSIIMGRPSARLASRLFDYDEVVRDFLGIEKTAEFYDKIKPQWKWNSRYWHQISLMRLDQAIISETEEEKKRNCELAIQHARHAQSIEPNHHFTLNTLSKVLFGSMKVLNEVNSSLLQEAIDCIIGAVKSQKRRNRITVHPYIILCRGINSISEFSPVYSFSQRQSIDRLISDVDLLFPRDKELVDEVIKARAAI